ncbi:MAG: endolytic transglycosylase MltG, partial [Patescibacteria group bacterium]
MITKLGIRLSVLSVLLILAVLGLGLWWHDATAPMDPENTASRIFVITPNEGIRSIATRLKHEGLIKDQIAFFLQVKIMGVDEKIQAGDFRLNAAMNIPTLAATLTHGTLDVWLTVLEG